MPGLVASLRVVHGHRDADVLAGCEALEIDVLRHVGDGVELHLAHQGAVALAAELEFEEARAPAALLQLLEHRAGLQRNQGGLSALPHK